MADKAYGLILDDIRVLRDVIRWWRGRGGSRRPVPTRRRVIGGGGSGNVIYAEVLSNVADSDPTFLFVNAVPIVGSAPPGGSGTAQNQYGQVYFAGNFVILSQRKDNDQWLTERGGTAGSQVVHFELTQDKSYADVSTLAVPVMADGTADFDADEFWVVDTKLQFYGKTATGGEDGYRGMALRFTDDHNSTGVPGYRIISMEGPAHLFIATLTEAWSMGSTNCSVGPDQIWGRPFRGVRLPASGDVAVFDDLNVAIGGEVGDQWLAAWDEADEHYVFVVPIQASQTSDSQYGLLIADVPAATPTYDATRSYIEHGYAADAVIPLVKVNEGGADGGDQLMAKLDGSDDQIILDCVNPIWTTIIKAGTTTNENKPVIVRGKEETWDIYTGSVESKTVFVLSAIFYPVTIMKGQAQGAVTGSAFTVDNLTLLWGRDPGVSSIATVLNPDSWEADDNAYCLIMQLTDGTWQAIDLACPEA